MSDLVTTSPPPPYEAVERPADAVLPSPTEVHTREVLGIPLAMTTYDGAMDVMDGMVARRDPGYVCAVAVHAVTVAQRDDEMRAALLGSSLTVRP
jgi:N-acetylglucosaminyldiphosphoundecaprenol N-acetyl-beta-D-mannosaminyltransferase